MLPFVLTLKARVLKTIFVTVIGLIAFFSIKRSAIFAFILGMLIYNFFNLKKNKILFSFLGLFLIAAVTYLVFLFADQQTDGYVSQRLDFTLNEGGSSGRDEIYLNVWSNILDADIVNFLFGHGNYATVNDFGLFAHNDYLEIIYDYGIILFFTYFLMVRSLFLFGIRLKNENDIPSHEIAAYFVSLVILVFLGMLNVIIVNPQYFGTSMFFIGLQMGSFYQIKMRKSFRFATNGSMIN
jgi:O-antigen ligase